MGSGPLAFKKIVIFHPASATGFARAGPLVAQQRLFFPQFAAAKHPKPNGPPIFSDVSNPVTADHPLGCRRRPLAGLPIFI